MPVGIAFVGGVEELSRVARAVAAERDVRLVAIATPHAIPVDPPAAPDRAVAADLAVALRERAEALGIEVVPSVDAALERDLVSILFDAAPLPERHAVALRALAAGRHVFSAWPLAPTLALARTQVAAAQAHDVALAGAPDAFLSPAWQTVRAEMDGAAIGRPVAVVAHVAPPLSHEGGITAPLAEVVTALTATFGPIAAVEAERGRTWPTRAVGEDSGVGRGGVLLLRFASGLLATILLGTPPPADLPRIEVFGEAGAMALPDPHAGGGAVRLRAGAHAWRDLPAAPGIDGPLPGLRDLLWAIRDRRAPRAHAALSLHALEVLEAAWEALHGAARVDVTSRPPRPIAVAGDEAAPLAAA